MKNEKSYMENGLSVFVDTTQEPLVVTPRHVLPDA